MPETVIKRDGTEVEFDLDKIKRAITACIQSAQPDKLPYVPGVTLDVRDVLNNNYTKPTVEQIQDIVERKLQEAGFYDAAKAYIIYRNEHAKQREKTLIPTNVKEVFSRSAQYFETPIQQFQFYDKYSRFNYDHNRRETWIETVDRVVAYLRKLSEDKLDDADYESIREGILNMQVMPSMRLLAMGGPAADVNNLRIYNCSYVPIDCVDAIVETLIISMNGCGVGFSVEGDYIKKFPTVEEQTGVTLPTHVVEDTTEGWAEALRVGLNTWMSGFDIDFNFSKIRPAGSVLRTKGGRASGPKPLRDMLSFIKELIISRENMHLRSIDAHDIVCAVGNAAVAGGTRRTAMISLFDFDDADMRNAKSGDFSIKNSQRWNANNSAVWPDRHLNQQEIQKFFMDIVGTGRGEPGIFSRGAAIRTMPVRRDKNHRFGTNPCVTGDTRILTTEGYVSIESVVDEKVHIWNGKEFSTVYPFSTGTNPIYEITLSNGVTLKCTDNHKFVIKGGDRKQLKDLKIGDYLEKFDMPVISVDGNDPKEDAYSRGFYAGDGNEGYNFSWVYETKDMCLGRLVGKTRHTPKYGRYVWKHGDILDKYFVPINCSLEYKLNWLAGYLDADGNAAHSDNNTSIVAESIKRDFLHNIQLMLTTLGIESHIIKGSNAGMRSMSDGKGGVKDYYCQETHRLCFGGARLKQLQELGLKTERLDLSNNNPQRDASRFVKVVGIKDLETEQETFCFTDELNHTGTFEGVVTGQCGEIVLRPMQLCNLSIVVARPEDTLATLKDKVRLATMIGTIQSMATHFPGLRDEWRKNCEEERLLGVDITGQMDSVAAQSAENQASLKSFAVEVNKTYAELLGINQSASVTCAKPSGNSSQLLNCAPGIHARWSRYYIRNVRVGAHTPIYHVLKDCGVPMDPENGQSEGTANTWVAHFPIASPGHAVTRDMQSAVGQCEYWKQVKQNFTEHNPSVTISYTPGEVIDVTKWVWENQSIIGGMAFLPYTDAQYSQMPFEGVSQAHYEHKAELFPEIDFSRLYLYEKEDHTTAAQELACSAGLCEI